MSRVADIPRAWARPRRVMARLLAETQREDRALALLMGACLVLFAAAVPGVLRGDAAIPLEARLGAAALGWLILFPLAAYVIAGLAHLLARLAGGRGSGYGARLALFWSLMAASPVWLLSGLLTAAAPGWIAMPLGAVALSLFVWLWAAGMLAAGWPDGGAGAGMNQTTEPAR